MFGNIVKEPNIIKANKGSTGMGLTGAQTAFEQACQD